MKILLLGSSGSIGTSVCNCVRRFRDRFDITGLAVNDSIQKLAEQAKEFDVSMVCVGSENKADAAVSLLPENTTVFSGSNGLVELVEQADYDVLLNALVGAVGFLPTVAALKRGKRVALANKESLVIGGDVIRGLTDMGKGSLVPVDSEHSAILQCLVGEDYSTIENLVITASGGPFRSSPIEDFAAVTPEQALDHPTWKMGPKITIDAATLMNKGFEVIEAHHLFRIPYDRLKVLIHPQSIMHSMVVFHDGAVMAQCGVPDMELPIQFALSYPDRLPLMSKRLDLASIGTLTFAEADTNKFRCLKHCIDAGTAGGVLPAVLNAANEVAVQAFLDKRIRFDQIATVVETALNAADNKPADSVEIIQETDQNTRKSVADTIAKGNI